MSTNRPTFSPIWHRVRLLAPRLRPHVEITRQHYRGQRWHVVHDPTSNQFFRLNPIAYDYVAMLDGTRTVEACWEAALTKFGDHAPTQVEIVSLVNQLYNADLLAVSATPETEQLLRRGRDRLKRKAAAQAVGIMYFRIKLMNPDRLLSACEPVLRPVLSRWGFAAWCALVIFALSQIVPHWSKLAAGLDSLMAPANLWLVPFVYVVTKLWHEFGHGVICKRFGGQVPEFGAMLLVFFPSPYVDASASWAFGDKWKRIAVGGGGMMFELFLASIAALVWSWAQNNGHSGELYTRIAYNVILTSGISTVIFNANPLMRFDGYYMLADLLETPNLAQRSNQMLLGLVQKYVYRLENVRGVSNLPGERAILGVYGVLSLVYRVFLFMTITLFVMGTFFGIGLVLAIWTAAAWFILPIGKMVHWLATSSQTADRRGRSVAITLGLTALAVLVLGVIPLPDRRHTTGIVESLNRTGVYAGSEGFVTAALKRPGDRVRSGEPIVTMESKEFVQRRIALLSQESEMEARERAALKDNDAPTAQLARDHARILRGNLDDLDKKIEALVVRAPHNGVVVGADPTQRIGAYLKRGEPICEVVDPDSLRIAATMDQAQGAWLFEQAKGGHISFDADVRLVSNVDRVLHIARVEVIPAGQYVLPSAALGFMGGGQIETENKDESGRKSKRPQFTVYISAEGGDELAGVAVPGERVRVRFKLETRPLLAQWIDRLKKEVQGRVKL